MIYDLSQSIFNNVVLDERVRRFAAFPASIEDAGGAWTRAIAWDEGAMP